MANGGSDFHVRVVSRSLVKASDPLLSPHILTLSNLDLIQRPFQVNIFCIYPKPATADFDAVVAAFATTLPSLLNHFFLFAGRIVTNPHTDLPEVLCNNEGAELVVAEADTALASLDFKEVAMSLGKIHLPYAEEIALSVQLVSFACGGFCVTWRTSHLLTDGHGICMLISMWSELRRSGSLAGAPNLDRAVFRPRAAPAYSPSLNKSFTALDGQHLLNVLTAEAFEKRLYYVEAHDISRLRSLACQNGNSATRVEAVSAYLWKALASVVGTSDKSCRMGWWVDGRPRLKGPKYAAAMRNYIGNVTTLASREASVEEIQQKPLSHVAAMVRETITEVAYGEHFREVVDWVEEHKIGRYVQTATVGLGSPTVTVTSFAAFPLDTDFGFGNAALVMPAGDSLRLCAGFLQVIARPGGDGSWLVSAFVWPRLAAAIEADGERIFKPVTAEYLGLKATNVRENQLSRL